MERKYQCELGIMALGILALGIMALGILAWGIMVLGKLSCNRPTHIQHKLSKKFFLQLIDFSCFALDIIN